MEEESVKERSVDSAKSERPWRLSAPTGTAEGFRPPPHGRAPCRNKPLPKGRVLIVEDEPAIAESLSYALSRAGYTTTVAYTLARALPRVPSEDLVLLDLMLPDGSGSQLVEHIRAGGLETAIVVLSSRDSEADRILALDSGADDYVTKPFSPREVVARIGAVLRRRGPPQPGAHPDALYLDETARVARRGGLELALTRVEFDLLRTLWAQPAAVHSRAALIERVWGPGFAITDRTVDSHVKSLRRKLSEAGASAQVIETVRGVGFRLRAEARPWPR